LQPENPYFHSIPATRLKNENNLIIKITKRKRRKEYKLEPFGIEQELIRWRQFADFQYQPKLSLTDPVINLVERGIKNLDINELSQFEMPQPTSNTTCSEVYLPPPVFSRHGLPQNFDFKPAGGATRQVHPVTGLTRLVNSTRYKVKTIQSILFIQDEIPHAPEESFLKELKRTELNPVEQKMKDLLDKERPVWTRLALLNQLSLEESKYVNNNKHVWPLIGYTFQDGPFRDLIIKFGYDPRKDPQARFYQHFVLRNLNNVRTKALPNKSTSTSSTSDKSHIFDGTTVYSKIGNFQLIDIHDQLSKTLIEQTEGVLSKCSPDPLEGWYAFDYLDQIKQVVRRKFMGLINHTGIVQDSDCHDLLGWELSNESRVNSNNGSKTTKKRPPRKSRTMSNDDTSDRGDTSQEEDSQEEQGNTSVGTGGSEAEGGGDDTRQSSNKMKPKPRKPVRAPWELPRMKKRRPKLAAETDKDIVSLSLFLSLSRIPRR